MSSDLVCGFRFLCEEIISVARRGSSMGGFRVRRHNRQRFGFADGLNWISV